MSTEGGCQQLGESDGLRAKDARQECTAVT